MGIEATLPGSQSSGGSSSSTSRRRCSGLALCSQGGAPLVFTLAELQGPIAATVAFSKRDGGQVLMPARLLGSAVVEAAERAFTSLALRGWCCSSSPRPARRGLSQTTSTGPLQLHLLRVENWQPAVLQELRPAVRGFCTGQPDASWIGSDVRAITAPFGSRFEGISLVETHGLIAHVSSPPGLLLTDVRCLGTSAGAGLVLTGEGSRADQLIGCIAPPLRSSSGEAVAVCVAVPLCHLATTLLDKKLARHLRPSEAAGLQSRPLPSQLPLPRGLVEDVRRGVALLWLETSGSWASAVVVSEAGHLVTCAHLLTGRSWMEIPPEGASSDSDSSKSSSASSTRPQSSSCRGRCSVMLPDGSIQTRVFEAEVLYICESALDVALLVAKPQEPPTKFLPIRWQQGRPPSPGAEVWAVGHGLFGPGTPWTGPAVTGGHVAKVAVGQSGRPAVIQSSAAVHRGCSGGALVNASTGELVGLVTTNVKHQDGAVMPSVNFSLPVTLLKPLPDYLAASNEPGALAALCEAWDNHSAADEQEKSLWRLEPEPLGLPSRVERRKRQALDRLRQLAEEARAQEGAATSTDPPAGPAEPPLRSSL